MKKKLPYIAIEGVGNTPEERLQSLIEIEPVLVMLGYDEPDEEWNNDFMENLNKNKTQYIIAYNDIKKICYHNHEGVDNPQRFQSTDLKAIINYVENYKE